MAMEEYLLLPRSPKLEPDHQMQFRVIPITLCKPRNETINQKISICTKIAQNEYRNRHDLVETVILCEVCEWRQINYINEILYMQTRICLGKWKTILLDFEIHTVHLIQNWRSDLFAVKKRRKLCHMSISQDITGYN